MTDAELMRRAMALAESGLGTTAPNPSVGAVIVRDGRVIGEGRTQPVGGPHAEVVALAAAGDARGATVYVTLEPCGHHGRTPPCTEALVAAGVVRVVVGTLDPFGPMRGASLAWLTARGVQVELGVEREGCERLILGFARAVTRGLPEVTLKAAISADGHIATAGGESQWITDEPARAEGHRLRGTHDAVLVGIGTVIADDPRLTCRLEGRKSPVPVVLDTRLRLPPGAHLDRPGAVILVGPDAPERATRAEVVRVSAPSGRVDPEAALRALASRGLHRVLVEGGGEVARSLLDAGLVDRVELFVAGKLIPGGRSWVGGPPIGRLRDALALELVDVRRVGPDAWLSWSVQHRSPPDEVA